MVLENGVVAENGTHEAKKKESVSIAVLPLKTNPLNLRLHQRGNRNGTQALSLSDFFCWMEFDK